MHRRGLSCALTMKKPVTPQTATVATALNGPKNVTCPICAYHQFLTYAPDLEKAKAEGFRHVIMGVYGANELHALPVRFWHCANCGYVLNFVMTPTENPND